MSPSRTNLMRGLALFMLLCAVSIARADLVTEYRYDTKMQMTREFTYDSGGGPTHSVTSYRYDELGRQTLVRRHATASLSEDDTNDDVTLYVYDVAGNLSKSARKGIASTSMSSIDSTKDIVSTYTYDALGRRITSTDSVGGQVIYDYDLSGNVTKQRNLLVGSTYADTVSEYDYLNRATKVTDSEGHYREISFNSRSLRFREIGKTSGGTALSRQRWSYDSLGRVTREGRLLDPTDTGDPAVDEDQAVDYVYDSDGRILTQTNYNTNSSTPLRTIFAYNPNGWLTQTTDPIGGYVQNLYNTTGTVTKRYIYDIMGTRTQQLDHDALDRLTRDILFGSTNRTHLYGYDGIDRRVSLTDPTGRETEYTYDALGRQVTATEDSGGLARATVSIYDRLGRLATLRAYDDDNAENQDTVYDYDLAMRRTRIAYPDTTGGTDSVRYSYDLSGRMTQRKTQDDVFTVAYAYDKRGLLTQKDDGTTYDRYVYDGAGRMLTAQKGSSGTADAVSRDLFAYDGLSRLTQEQQAILQGTAKVLDYTYDQVGNRLTMKFEAANANSLLLAYDYDDLSQNVSVQAKFTTNGGAPTSYQDLITYDYVGRFMTKRSIQTRYKYESAYSTKDLFLQYRPEYDSQRFVTKVTNATRYGSGAGSDHDELAQFTYTFNAAGDRLSNSRHRGSGGNAEGFSKMQQIDAYAYDTLHRLTTVDYNTGGVTGDEVYVYDSLGNRVTYTDQRNSITRAYANNKANEYTSVATFGVTHDPAGNLARQVVDGSGNAYVYNYDCDNRLLNVQYDPVSSTVNTALATFAYDALGRRITAWTQFDINAPGGDNQTQDLRFYHDGQVEIADYDANDALSRRFINGTQYIDERAVLVEGEAASADTFYYLLQELYTVTGLIEKNGALAETNVYDGYGKVTIWDYSPGDFDRDGDVDATDQISFNAAKPVGGTGSGVPAKDPMADLDMDGDVDNTDSTAFTTIKNAGGAVTEAFVSSIGNPFFFTGRRLYFLETLPEISSTAIANQQIQHNRARDYVPDLGRWGQRDPYMGSNPLKLSPYFAGGPTWTSDWLVRQYQDGTNLYGYVSDNPESLVDPSGLKEVPHCVVVVRLNHEGKGQPYEGESECSAWGNVTCNADQYNYEQCKDDKGNPIFEPNGKPKMCPKAGSIPDFPHIDTNVGPAIGGKWDQLLAAAWQRAGLEAKRLAKDCKCSCKQIVAKFECEWSPATDPNVNTPEDQYAAKYGEPWYDRYCRKQTAQFNDDGSRKAYDKNSPQWRGLFVEHACQKASSAASTSK